jgi:hypothetical protein
MSARILSGASLLETNVITAADLINFEINVENITFRHEGMKGRDGKL